MRARKLLLQLTTYYVVIGILIFAAIKIWPAILGWLPIGGAEQLIAAPAKNSFGLGKKDMNTRAIPLTRQWRFGSRA